MAEREEEADAHRAPAVGHQLAGRAVDRRDVVGVERVAQPEHVRRQPEAGAHGAGPQRAEADQVQRDDHRRRPGNPLHSRNPSVVVRSRGYCERAAATDQSW